MLCLIYVLWLCDMLCMLWAQGNTPPLQQALELHSILTQSDTNLRQPVALKEQLLLGRMGSDVGKSMLQMLQVNHVYCLYSCL